MSNDYKIPDKGKYKYSVYYTHNSSSLNPLFTKIGTFKCWADTKEYYELEYIFDVK